MDAQEIRDAEREVLFRLRLAAIALEDMRNHFAEVSFLDPNAAKDVAEERTKSMNTLSRLFLMLAGVVHVLQEGGGDLAGARAANLVKECDLALAALRKNRLIDELRNRPKGANG